MRTTKGIGRGDVPGQLQIEWSTAVAENRAGSTRPNADLPPLVQHLKWDFVTSFPEPTPEAIDAGVISNEDTTPEGIRAIHDEHARELLMTLHDWDAVLDARRRGVDPVTGKPPSTNAASERLQKLYVAEPERLERWFQNLMDSYEQAFGGEAAEAFGKAIRARHGGIPVVAEKPSVDPVEISREDADKSIRRRVRKSVYRTEPRRTLASLPVPKPLPTAIAAGQFGLNDEGKPIRPGSHEIREITLSHAEKLIDLLDALASGSATGKEMIRTQFDEGIAAYAEDFGPHAAARLEAYVRRQASLERCDRRER